MTTYYVDYEGGNDANDGLSFANRKKTLQGASAVTSPGDEVRVMAAPAPTALGVDVTWTDLSPTLTLAAALTANVSLCQAGWTASANVTSTTSTTRKQGTVSTQIAIAAGFTTGLAAYEATGTLDLSGYQQISFWIRQSAGTLGAAGAVRLQLSTDATGTTVVHNIDIPALAALNQWVPVTVDLATNLNSAIESVGFDVVTDNGAQTFQIDNILAVKANGADSLSLQSMIGKANSLGAGGDDSETWYCIRSIDGVTVILETGPNSSAGTMSRGYSGTSETVAGYKQETTKTDMSAASGTDIQTFTDDGSSGNPITISGGWNRTDMSTQTGYTWFDGLNGFGDGLTATGADWLDVSRLGFVRYNNGLNSITGTNCTWTTITANNNGSVGFNTLSGNNCTWTTITANNNLTAGLGTLSGNNCSWNGVTANNTTNTGIGALSGSNCNWMMITANNHTTTGIITLSGNNCLFDTVTTRNSSTGSGIQAVTGQNILLSNVVSNGNSLQINVGSSVINCINATLGAAPSNFTAFANGQVRITRYGNDPNDHRIYADGGTSQSQSSVRHTTSGIAWQINPTSTNRSATYQLTMPVGTYAFAASAQTVKLWLRRTNTRLTLGLRLRGGQLQGVDSDVEVAMTAAADTWEEVTINFTPTGKGVAELEVYAYGGTTYTGYCDDLTVNGVAIPLDYGWNGGGWMGPPESPGAGGGLNPLNGMIVAR